jgi:serine/threonine protein kinase
MPGEINNDGPWSGAILNQDKGITYNRGKLLGKGGFAKVYEITHPYTGIIYADKIIFKEIFSRRKSTQEKVRKEIDLHRNLEHTNVVQFIDCFEDSLHIHIVLEYCGMKSLLHLLRKRKILPENEVRRFVLQICNGVRYIHGKRILHRDLKLGNMFLTTQGVVKIGDFGLAATMEDTNEGSRGNGTLCGTPNYIAPEVLLKRGHRFESDYWAIGCMTYALLSGNPPFETTSLRQTYEKILGNDYSIPEHFSRQTSEFVSRLLHANPEERGNLDNSEDFLNAINIQENVTKDSATDSTRQFLNRLLAKSSSNVLKTQHYPGLPLYYVTKWIDYSNKFGFGYQLNDMSMGVIFNDKSRISSDTKRIPRKVTDSVGNVFNFSNCSVPKDYKTHLKLMSHFQQYMEENLADSISTVGGCDKSRGPAPEVIQWHRTSNCVVMVLSNRSVQVNFLREHYKLMFLEEHTGEIKVHLLSHKNYQQQEINRRLVHYCTDIFNHVQNLLCR